MQGKAGRSVGFLKVSLVFQETKKFGSRGRRRGSEGVSLLAFPSTVKEFAYVLLALKFSGPRWGSCVNPGSKVLGDCSSLRGKEVRKSG